MSQNQHTLPDDQFSFKDILTKLISFKDLIVGNWKFVVILTMLGVGIGFVIELITKKPPTYTSEIVFNMDNSTGASGGGLSDLASAFGISGAVNANGGLFSGENFLELLKTKNLYNRAILSVVDINGRKVIFGNYFLEKSGAIENEFEDDVDLKTFRFKHTDYEKFTPIEKSRVRMIQDFLMPLTIIANENKKASLMTLSASTRNDTLSHTWTNLFLNTVTSFYIENKTKKTRELLGIMEHRVDSLQSELFGTQRKYARVVDQNQQVIMQQGLIEQQRLSTNSSQLQGMYFDAVRSLDNLRFSVVKESPLFTRVDDSELPIAKDITTKGKGIKLGGSIGLILAILYLAIRKALKDISTEK